MGFFMVMKVVWLGTLVDEYGRTAVRPCKEFREVFTPHPNPPPSKEEGILLRMQ